MPAARPEPASVGRSPRPLRAPRWLAAAALGAVVPKCLLCAAAYAGLGGALGLGSAELCGAPAPPALSGTAALAGLGVAFGVAVRLSIAPAANVRRRLRRIIRPQKPA